MGGALALDAAWLFAAFLAVSVLGAAAVAARRFWLERRGGTVECGLRLAGGPWRLGLASYEPEELYWFGLFKITMRPTEVFGRRELTVAGRRAPTGPEAGSLGPGLVVVEGKLSPAPGGPAGPTGPGALRTVELALSEPALTGLLAWLEAAPPVPLD